jgi:hypothetical protein
MPLASFGFEVCIGFVEFVPLVATGLVRVFCSERVAAKQVFLHRYRLKMIWPNTPGVLALVVQCQTIRDRSDLDLVGNTVSNCGNQIAALLSLKRAISPRRQSPIPDPAVAGLIYMAPEPIPPLPRNHAVVVIMDESILFALVDPGLFSASAFAQRHGTSFN